MQHLSVKRWFALFVILTLSGCDAPAPSASDQASDQTAAVPGLAVQRSHLSIADVAMETCDTPPELVSGLSAQLVDAINCLRPGTLSDIPIGADIGLLRTGRPAYVDARGLDDLIAAADAGDRQMVVRWSYRDVALQHLFWLQDDFRNCAVAAPAGQSNHQNGLAVDLNDRAYWEPIMARFGWENRLPNDRVHFDYQRANDVGLGALSLLAFQALWNKNNPDAPIPTSSELDGDTYDALGQAPIEGFDRDLCDGGAPPIGPGPVRGPTVAQSAWRGCDIPGPLIGGLSNQIVEAMRCEDAAALVPLRYCDAPGCLLPADDPPLIEWLGADAHAAFLAASADLDAPLTINRAFVDVATQHFLASATSNIGCPVVQGAARSPFNTGLAVRISSRIQRDRLDGMGFSTSGTATLFNGGANLTALNVLAFQKLWNRNREDDPIDEDGLIGPQTRGAIDRSPIAGFMTGLCDPPEPEPEPEGQPEPQPEPEGQPEPEPQPEGQPEPQPEGQPEPQPEGQPEGQPDPQPEGQPDPQPEGQPGQPEPQPEPQPTEPAPVRRPIAGWSGIAEDDGCTQRPGEAPGLPGWLGLAIMGCIARRRR